MGIRHMHCMRSNCLNISKCIVCIFSSCSYSGFCEDQILLASCVYNKCCIYVILQYTTYPLLSAIYATYAIRTPIYCLTLYTPIRMHIPPLPLYTPLTCPLYPDLKTQVPEEREADQRLLQRPPGRRSV